MAQYEVTLRDYWRILRRRKGIVVFTAFLLGFFSFVLATIWQPIPIYTAVAKVQLISGQQSLANLYLEAYGAGGGGDDLETQMSVITSFPLLKLVVKALDIPAETEDDTARVIIGLQNSLDIDQEGYAKILLIKTDHNDPEQAANIVNVVSQVFKEYSDEQKNQQSDQHLSFVNRQMLEAKDSLRVAEEAARRYREDNDIVSIDAEASMMLGQITQAGRDITRIEQVLNVIGGMIREIEIDQELSPRTLQGVNRAQVGDSFIAFAQQLNTLRLDRDALLVQFTENHPAVRQLQAKIDLMVENMANELRQRDLTMRGDLEGIEKQLDELRADYSNLPARGLALGRYERAVYLRQEIVEALAGEFEQARIRAADRVETAKVLQKALVPTFPNNPHSPVQRAVMGMILGLVLGVVFAVVAETLDTSIGTIEDVQEYTDAKVVGVIPFIRAESVEASMKRRGHVIESERMLQRMAQLVAYFDPQSTLAETYRTLRTNIEFVTVEKGDKTILVTSSTSGEGKSTVMANLAMTMTQLGKRTLLVDCDLRKPTVARMFGLDKEPGLAEVIVGNYEWREVIRTVTDIVTGGMGMEDLMQTQGISNLHIITSGAIPPNPAELLNSGKMVEFIAEVKDVYDIVLFDAPPILHVTDAAILGKHIDGVLMIYKAGDIPRTSLKRSVNLLNSVGIHLLGIVLNGIRAEISADYYDFGYNSYYAYGAEEEPELTWLEKAQDYVFNWRSHGEEDDDEDDEDNEDNEREGSIGGGESQDREDDYDEDEGADEDEDYIAGLDPGQEDDEHVGAENHADSGRLNRLVGTVLFFCAILGLGWQSGYLQRPLGVVPVFSSYNRIGVVDGSAAAAIGGEELLAVVSEVPLDGEETILDTRAAQASVERVPQPLGKVDQPASFAPTQAPVAQPQITGKALPYTLRISSYGADSKWAVPNLNKLRQAGQMAFLVPRSGPESMLRLLSGSFADWDAAYQEGRRLRDATLTNDIAPAYLPYAAELGRFASQQETLLFLQELGEKARFCYVQGLDGGGQRVLAGAFETREEAVAIATMFGRENRAPVVRR
ncbi:MAG: capsular exopolysaccharide synthesis family protein [Planctomycetota bacterium]|jgi:capsular exopolysaccharide synthesis family protein